MLWLLFDFERELPPGPKLKTPRTSVPLGCNILSRCLVALDDEAFTCNKRVSHLATIQEHYMIIKALERGASEARIAASLNLDVAAIRKWRGMLDGICPEVVDDRPRDLT
jgi:hypothetical protein